MTSAQMSEEMSKLTKEQIDEVLGMAKSHLVLDPQDGHTCSASQRFASALLALHEELLQIKHEFKMLQACSDLKRRQRYKEAAKLIQTWLNEQSDYDEHIYPELTSGSHGGFKCHKCGEIDHRADQHECGVEK